VLSASPLSAAQAADPKETIKAARTAIAVFPSTRVLQLNRVTPAPVPELFKASTNISWFTAQNQIVMEFNGFTIEVTESPTNLTFKNSCQVPNLSAFRIKSNQTGITDPYPWPGLAYFTITMFNYSGQAIFGAFFDKHQFSQVVYVQWTDPGATFSWAKQRTVNKTLNMAQVAFLRLDFPDHAKIRI
jgi:hypothetical protein